MYTVFIIALYIYTACVQYIDTYWSIDIQCLTTTRWDFVRTQLYFRTLTNAQT